MICVEYAFYTNPVSLKQAVVRIDQSLICSEYLFFKQGLNHSKCRW